MARKIDFSHEELGYNYRLSNLQAAVACAQIRNLRNIILKKKELEIYTINILKIIKKLNYYPVKMNMLKISTGFMDC